MNKIKPDDRIRPEDKPIMGGFESEESFWKDDEVPGGCKAIAVFLLLLFIAIFFLGVIKLIQTIAILCT